MKRAPNLTHEDPLEFLRNTADQLHIDYRNGTNFRNRKTRKIGQIISLGLPPLVFPTLLEHTLTFNHGTTEQYLSVILTYRDTQPHDLRKPNDSFQQYIQGRSRVNGKLWSEFDHATGSFGDFGPFAKDLGLEVVCDMKWGRSLIYRFFSYVAIHMTPYGRFTITPQMAYGSKYTINSREKKSLLPLPPQDDGELRDYRPTLHRILEMYAHIPRKKWHSPRIYAKQKTNPSGDTGTIEINGVTARHRADTKRFSIDELDDGFRINGIPYQGKMLTMELEKEPVHVLDHDTIFNPKKNKGSREIAQPIVGSIPLNHALFSTLYANREAEEYASFFAWVRTLLPASRGLTRWDGLLAMRSEFTYRSKQTTFIVHDEGTPLETRIESQNLKNHALHTSLHLEKQEVLQEVLGSSDCPAISDIYSWLIGKQTQIRIKRPTSWADYTQGGRQTKLQVIGVLQFGNRSATCAIIGGGFTSSSTDEYPALTFKTLTIQDTHPLLEDTLTMLFTAEEQERLAKDARIGLSNRWQSVPRLNIGPTELPSITNRLVDGAGLLIDHLARMQVMSVEEAERLVTTRLTHYLIHDAGFQLSRERADAVIAALKTEPTHHKLTSRLV